MNDQIADGPAGTPDRPAYPDVHVQLTGENGNALTIIVLVKRALRREVDDQAASTFVAAALTCGSYDELLALAMCTVDVS